MNGVSEKAHGAKRRKSENGDGDRDGNDTKNTKSKKNKQITRDHNYDHVTAAMERPKIFLTKEEFRLGRTITSEDNSEKEPAMLNVAHIRHLLLFLFREDSGLKCPSWCKVLRRKKAASVMLVVMNDVSASDYLQNQDCFPFVSDTFIETTRSPSIKARMKSPSSFFSTFDFEVYAVPLHSSQVRIGKKLKWKAEQDNSRKSSKKAKKDAKNQTSAASSPHQISDNTNGKTSSSSNSANDILLQSKTSVDKTQNDGGKIATQQNSQETMEDCIGADSSAEERCSRTQLLLSVKQQQEEGYPLPSSVIEKGFVFSKKKYEEVTPRSPLFAVDCEMCMTCGGYELTRVSVVDENNKVIYDELVKPHNPIINYLTRFSGITPKMLAPVTKRLADVQKELQDLLPGDAILCGQSLGNDLKALKMFHPYVIDTSVIYNLSGNRKIKCGLRRLTLFFLNRVIQDTTVQVGHSSSEDAEASLDLVKLKLQNGLQFGDAVSGGLPLEPSWCAEAQAFRNSMLSRVQQEERKRREELQKQEPRPRKRKNGYMTPMDNDKWKKEFPDKDCSGLGSFFTVLEALDVTSCLIGEEKMVAKYRGEPQLTCLAVSSDKRARKKAAEVHTTHKFTWVELNTYANMLSKSEEEQSAVMSRADQKQLHPTREEEREALTQMDKSLKKLMKKVVDNTVMVVVMTGRSVGNEHQDGAVMVHIARHSQTTMDCGMNEK